MNLPPQTCKLIDQIIDSFNYEILQEDVGKNFSELAQSFRWNGSNYSTVEDAMEAIRKANADLRTAAEEAEKCYEELEYEFESAKRESEDKEQELLEEIKDLKKQIDKLEIKLEQAFE